MNTTLKLLLIFGLIASSFSFFTRRNSQDPIAKVLSKQAQMGVTLNKTIVSAENNTTNTTTQNRT